MIDDKAEVALKYLDLARGEILERTKFVNQTLGSYLLGSAALASWFFQTVYKPVGESVSFASGPAKAPAAIGFALMIAYLALAANWIIHHNERIVAALARYQSENLSPILKDDPPMWERSDALKIGDSRTDALRTVFVEELIVLSPPVVALIFALWQAVPQVQTAGGGMCLLAGVGLAAALSANLATVKIGVAMYAIKRDLRPPNPETASPPSLADSAIQPLASN
jgi:predicted permease